jgi:intracellular multiplication protein IcmS
MKKDVSEMLVAIAKEMNAKFYLLGKMISAEEVFAPTGLLPAFAKRAEDRCLFCVGFGLGISMKDSEQGILNAEVVFDEATPMGLRLAFITDVLCEMIDSSPTNDYTPLDELLKEHIF